jgi:hypothetical protein
MSAKLINSAAGALAAFFAVTGVAFDQDPFREATADEFISPWCRIGAPETWEGKPCVVPLSTWPADGTAFPR